MIHWQIDGHIARLTLDRGTARNAIPIAGFHAVAAAAADIAGSGARAVILDSAMPGSFSAGADLAEMPALIERPERRSAFREAMACGIEAVAALPMPVIAAVDGGCFGAAVALILACDIVIAGDAAVFATTPAKLGLSYPASDVARLNARVGPGNAAIMLFTGNRLDADAACATGLAQIRAPHAGTHANALAATIAGNVPGAIVKLKRVLCDPAGPGHDAAFDDAFGAPDLADRLGAFLAGRR